VVAGIDFDAGVCLQDLFDLAVAFDDGHGLHALKIQGLWRYSDARLFQFGGGGTYHSALWTLSTWSGQTVTLGQEIDKALESSDAHAAAAALCFEVRRMLQGIRSDSMRTAVSKELATLLANANALTK
jgi:hypothetical protein